jgi:hypothetical protein
MSDADLLNFILLVWAGVATGLWLDARRDAKITKRVVIHLVENKAEREKFFAGADLMIKSKGNFDESR